MATYDWVAEEFFGPAPSPEDVAGEAAVPPAPEQPPKVFVVFDLETTGLEAKKERIAEIGAIKFDRRGPIGRFSVLVNPGIPMPAAASKINGITDAMLADKPNIDEVLPDFLAFIGDAVIIAHNASFDCAFVNAALSDRWERSKRVREEAPGQGSLLGGSEGSEDSAAAEPQSYAPPFPALPNRVVDTLVYAKEAFPGRYKYSLQELAKYLGVNAIEAHRAEDDARVCMEIFIKCAEKSAGREVQVNQ